jgi:hypothetical protein
MSFCTPGGRRSFRTVRVSTYVVRVECGGVVADTTSGEYGDWNWEDYHADILLRRPHDSKTWRYSARAGDGEYESL